MLRRFWYRQTIRTQVLIAVGIINLCAALIAGIVTVCDARKATQAEMDSSIELARRLVRVTIMSLSPEGDVDSVSKRINELTSRLRLAHLRHVRIFVGDASGRLEPVTSREFSGGTEEKLAPAPRWFAALVAPDVSPQHLSVALAGSGPGNTFIVEQPVDALPQVWPLGTVVISGEPEDEIAEVWRDTTSLALIWLFLDALVLGVLFLVLGRMLDPLASLARGMTKLEDGHYATRLPEPEVRELATISDRFNLLAEALGRSRAENAKLYGQLIMVQEEERREVANEIHDEASPCLFGITANALSAQRLTGRRSDKRTVELRSHINEILKVTQRLNQMNRMLLKKLRPVALGRVALTELLDDLIGEMQRRYPDVQIATAVRTAMPSYGETVDLTIYRCVQEGVTNAIRHGNAKTVRVALKEKNRKSLAGMETSAPRIELTIVDDGAGISADTKAGFGLTVMRERVQALGGTFAIGGIAGRGTTLNLDVPLDRLSVGRPNPRQKVNA